MEANRVKSNRGERDEEARQIEAAGGGCGGMLKSWNLRDWEWFTFDGNVPVTGGLCTSNSTGGQELNRTRIPVRTARSVKSLGAFFWLSFPWNCVVLEISIPSRSPRLVQSTSLIEMSPYLAERPSPTPRLKRDILTYLVTCVRRAQY